MTIHIPAPTPTARGKAEVYTFLSHSDPGTTHYTLVYERGIECTCKGFQFNGRCWHYDEIESMYHSCLCGRRFKTAQGLNGHMRTHRRIP